MLVDTLSAGLLFPRTTPNLFVRWFPPKPRFVKINFDISLINFAAAGDFIIRGWTGKLIKAGATNYGSASILMAEARALRDEVRTAIQAGYNKMEIEG